MLPGILAVIKVTVYYNKQLFVRLVVNDIAEEKASFIFCLAIGFIRSERLTEGQIFAHKPVFAFKIYFLKYTCTLLMERLRV